MLSSIDCTVCLALLVLGACVGIGKCPASPPKLVLPSNLLRSFCLASLLEQYCWHGCMVDSDHDYAQVDGITVGMAAGLTVVQAMADSS